MSQSQEYYAFIHGYTEWGEDLSDGVWMATLEEATEAFNKEEGTNYDIYDHLQGYIEFSNAELIASQESK